ATGRVLEVAGGGLNDGALVRVAPDNGSIHQRWDIRRQYHRFDSLMRLDGYYAFLNANSGRAAEVENYRLDDFAPLQQYGTDEITPRHWSIVPAEDGYFHIRNGFSNSYLTSSLSSAYQLATPSGHLSQWRFEPANPDASSALVRQYDFEDGLGDATAIGNPSFGTSGVCTGTSLVLDGVDDTLTLPGSIANTDDITVAAWVKWNGGAPWQRLFDFHNDTQENFYLTPSSSFGTMHLAITTNGSTREQHLDTAPLPTGVWTHVAVTIGGHTAVVYVNGRPATAGQVDLNPSDVAPTILAIGRSPYGDPLFRGEIDELRLYDIALTADQVAALARGCCDVDRVSPFGTLDHLDVLDFLDAFEDGCP
ncbi:MAG: RICIN domain-containing protein, partial [Phycisphaerales bacterium]|nr:RICIN domain-containing protein [Phycisphaerales bacterium]